MKHRSVSGASINAQVRSAFAGIAIGLVCSVQTVATDLAPAEPKQPEKRSSLTFGIVPQQSATRLASVWVPYLKELGDAAGITLEFATAKDIPTFEACLANGAYDVAYMNPYHYTVFSEISGYRAIARQRDKKLMGLIVARKDSDIAELEALDQQAVAFPSPAAFGASVIPRAEMNQRGVTFEPKYVKSHDSVYRTVSAGIIPAGGGVLRTFNTVPLGIREDLKIVYQTKGYTPHAFALHARIGPEEESRLSTAMLLLSDMMPELLEPLGMKGIELGEDKDWDDVRALGLTSSHTEIVRQGAEQCRSG